MRDLPLTPLFCQCAQANALRLEKFVLDSGFRGFRGFSGSEEAVTIALPKKWCNAGLRVFKEHGVPLALNQF